MSPFIRFADAVDRLTEKTGSAVSWLSGVLVAVVCFDVLTRYLFNYTSTGMAELEWHLFSVLFLIGAGYTLKHQKHVRVDVFYHTMSEKSKAWVNLSGHLFALIPFSVLVIWSSFPFVASSFSLSETSPDPGGLPFRWLIKAMIPAGFSFLILQSLAEVVRQIQILTGNREKETPGDH